ncbi:MAG: ORF6N domain-containing protein [Firmicutes bacterium]|nr:ORF6N domain-containing protein [Bacillota bacterium]MCL2313019.1 ORF6N domain-containing protein [Bacillota bacterium]MCL2313148.1 ORF6N domain-containing protein [Bacillota bacterium]
MELEPIQNKIYEIRGYRVMLDFDLARLYGTETKRLKERVKRNIKRFLGDDFMFELTVKEWFNLRSQIATSSWGGTRYRPFAFTELGVSMLSSILDSDTAIEENRKIMRAFVMLRQYALDYAELNRKIDNFMLETNTKFSEVYQVLTELAEQKKKLEEKPQPQPRRPIGFKTSWNQD